MKFLINILFLLLCSPLLKAQCPGANCPTSPVTICDLTPNNATLWAETYWLDNRVALHDLAEAPTDLNITGVDDCVGGVHIRYQLFLDLDNNTSLETLIDSDSLGQLAGGTVPFDNINTPGGTARTFDERPVTADQKYRFAIMEVAGPGNNKTASVRWNTSADPGTYVIPELPLGTHKIKWYVSNALGDEIVCEYQIIVTDCKKPTLVCINGLSVNLMPTGLIQLWASDFLQYAEDNHTPTGQIQIGLRKSGTGTGFPLNPDGTPQQSVVYDCNELGTQLVELWARDWYGNADYCETYVIVQDNMGNCGGDPIAHLCVWQWCTNAPITGLGIELSGSSPALPPTSLFYPDSVSYDPEGCQIFPLLGIPYLGNYGITPQKDDAPLNGVTVLDLIRIRKHILGLEPLPSPYAMIAADLNRSGSITAFDLVEGQKLLTGVYSELPSNTSWRFVDADFVFPNPANPFQTIFPETKSVINLLDSTIGSMEFKGIKIGDVDCSALPGLVAPPEDRASSSLTLPDVALQAGETIDLPIYPSETAEWLGFQLGLRYDTERLRLEAVVPGHLPNWDPNTTAQPAPGLLNIAWFDVRPSVLSSGEPLFYLRLSALAPVRVREALGLAPGRLHAESVWDGEDTRNLKLQFAPAPTATTGIGLPQPNPTQGGAMIPLNLRESAVVGVEIRDLQGRLLWRDESARSAGMQQLALPATAFAGSGIYLWRVEAGGQVQSGKIAVTH